MTAASVVVEFILAPLTVASVIGMATWTRSIGDKIKTHDTALALLVNELTPVDKPNLRELIHDVRNKQGIDATLFAAHVDKEDERYRALDHDRHRH